MSQENVEIVRAAFEAWEPAWRSGADDLSGLLAFLDDDLVCRFHMGPGSDTRHGIEGFLDLTSEWLEVFDDFTLSGEEFIDARDHVVVRLAQEGRVGASDTVVTGTFWVLYGVRGGKLATIDMYATREEALEAAGLSE